MCRKRRVAFALREPFHGINWTSTCAAIVTERVKRSLSLHGRLRRRRRPGVLRMRLLPGEVSRRPSDTRTGAGSATHSIDKASSATTLLARPSHSTRIATLSSSSASHSRSSPLSPLRRARNSRVAGVMTLTPTAGPDADCKIRRTRPSAARRRWMFDIHTPPPWAPTTYAAGAVRRPRCPAPPSPGSTG
jgi:hypothetical protein